MLASPAISQQETERKATELVLEFLRLWFTGNPVTIAGAATTLPPVTYHVGQSIVPQPSEFSQIHFVQDVRPKSMLDGSDSKLVRSALTLTFQVRTSKSGDKIAGAAGFENRRLADALKQVFESEKKLLAQKGIHHLKVVRGPAELPSPLCLTRLLIVTGELSYSAAA